MGAAGSVTQECSIHRTIHWDFDLPSVIYDLPFLNEQQKRQILGGNALKFFGMEAPKKKLAVIDGVAPVEKFPAMQAAE